VKKLILALACMFLVAPCPARIITVDDDGPADFNNIQAAIDDANNGDTIIVCPGSYIENINFLGKDITMRSTDPNDLDVIVDTIIDGNYQTSVVSFAGTESNSCHIIGFSITHGRKGVPVQVDLQKEFGDVE
jgi:pectin methylesterase-like acyl-CoA thioesterase